MDLGGPAMTAAHNSRGCAFGDFDNDGDIDVLIVNLNEPPSLLRNDVKSGHHWLKVKLIGQKSNRNAIGATVVARYGERTQAQAVTSQTSFYSANGRRLHFGLGQEKMTHLEVRWPNGEIEEILEVAVDQLVIIRVVPEAKPRERGIRQWA